MSGPSIINIKATANSLFIRLLASFSLIILLLTSFCFFSLSLYRDNILSEIIKYNSLNLKNTTESYEDHFRLIKQIGTSFFFNDKVLLLDNGDTDYYAAQRLMGDIKNSATTPRLYLENFIFYYKKSSFTLEKSRGSSDEKMFNLYYNSDKYPLSFWQKQFSEKYSSRILPPTHFSENDEFPAVGRLDKGLLIPIIIKNSFNPEFYIIALVNAQQMFEAFHQSVNSDFFILDGSGKPFFTSTGIVPEINTPPGQTEGFVQQGEYYYFYKKSDVTGLTYVNPLPNERITEQLHKLNFTLIWLLVVSIFISVIASLLFTIRFHNPIKMIIASIQQLNTNMKPQSSIREFNWISENIKSLVKAGRDARVDLAERQSVLRTFALTNQLKNIRHDYKGVVELHPPNTPYFFVMYQLYYKNEASVELGASVDRASNYIREFIDSMISEFHPLAHTFQIENDQIMSLVYLDAAFEDQPEETIHSPLEKIKRVLDLDIQYCFLTISVSPLYRNSDDYTTAYEYVLDLAKHRKFRDETQIIRGRDRKESQPFSLSPLKEQELEVNLANGNEPEAALVVKRALSELERKAATAQEVHAFAADIASKILKAIPTPYLSTDTITRISEGTLQCFSFPELETNLMQLIQESASLIRQLKEKRDHITDFVLDYIKAHYMEDISLDILADKLNISSSYLSSYFKEKTGVNFVDFVNKFRIQKVKKLLLNKDIRIFDAAAQVGYQNLNSFNRMFKKFSGMTPSHYRKSEGIHVDDPSNASLPDKNEL
jgi:two-component system response regulator YesN